MSILIEPCGGRLVDLVEPRDSEIARHAATLPSIRISERSRCDLELLATGAFSPLDRFMGQRDHQSVLDTMRLADGTLFPIPLTLPIAADANIELHHQIALRGPDSGLLAVMIVEEIYGWDVDEVAEKVFRTIDRRHPVVAEMDRWGKLNVSGPLRVLSLPIRHDFRG